MAMDNIRACRPDDIGRIVELHQRAHWASPLRVQRDNAYLQRFYTKLLFENPWLDERLPPLVSEDTGGRIVGFLGRIPRRMTFDNHEIVVAVATRLVVDQEHPSPFAAIELIRSFMAGPQDLSYSDGATSAVRKFWEVAGGTSIPIWSLKWAKVLRPCLFASVGRKRGRNEPSIVPRVICRGVDAFASRFSPFSVPKPETSSRPLATRELRELFHATSAAFAIRPLYEERDIRWLLEFAEGDEHWGPVQCTAVDHDTAGTLGWYIHVPKRDGISEVLAIGARPRSHGVVLQHLIHTAKTEGAAAIQGRLWPHRLDDYWDQGCVGKRGPWTIAHARDSRILNAVVGGDAFLSCLEGELWMPPTS